MTDTELELIKDLLRELLACISEPDEHQNLAELAVWHHAFCYLQGVMHTMLVQRGLDSGMLIIDEDERRLRGMFSVVKLDKKPV